MLAPLFSLQSIRVGGTKAIGFVFTVFPQGSAPFVL